MIESFTSGRVLSFELLSLSFELLKINCKIFDFPPRKSYGVKVIM